MGFFFKKFPNGMTSGKMLLDCMAISITPCLMGYYIFFLFFLCTYMMIKVTILSAQPLIPPKRLYAQKAQACFDMY